MAEFLIKAPDGLYYKVSEKGTELCSPIEKAKYETSISQSAEFRSLLQNGDGEDGTDYSGAGHGFGFSTNTPIYTQTNA